eukprot:CAMPEP_0179129170 /NCGR_PEP_ID=MMETSP0796-20121207/61275_1 /TAXON_ID=73915 /ORGANISM="Pyrodinium bahamense, Strain pbaha01" /LENGTH=69 /DNA_ID=CAMNT_0020828039 /DNA_START=10 /DNA_END=216 /DNA_ORIENTATION=+
MSLSPLVSPGTLLLTPNGKTDARMDAFNTCPMVWCTSTRGAVASQTGAIDVYARQNTTPWGPKASTPAS